MKWKTSEIVPSVDPEIAGKFPDAKNGPSKLTTTLLTLVSSTRAKSIMGMGTEALPRLGIDKLTAVSAESLVNSTWRSAS